MIEVELHGTRFEVTDPFGEPQIVVDDAATGYRGTYRADPRADGKWFGSGDREVINPLSREDLEIALAAAREKAGPEFFARGEEYLLVLKGGEVVVGRCAGAYAHDHSSILMKTDDGEVAVMLRTIRTAIKEDPAATAAKDKPLEAVRVRFSCGHSGGAWPEDATRGASHLCLQCGETVTVVTVVRSAPPGA